MILRILLVAKPRRSGIPVEPNLLRHRAKHRVLPTINRQNVFRRHLGLEQVGRAEDVTATVPEQFAEAPDLGGHLVGCAVRQQVLHVGADRLNRIEPLHARSIIHLR